MSNEQNIIGSCPQCGYPIEAGHAPTCPNFSILPEIEEPTDVRSREVDSRAEEIIRTLGEKVLDSSARYFLAWYMRDLLNPDLKAKLDQFRNKEEVSFTEEDEVEIKTCCESIIDFFRTNFPEEYFERLAEVKTETPEMSQPERKYREQLRDQLGRVVDELSRIRSGYQEQLGDLYPEEQDEKLGNLINAVHDIQDKYCYIGPIRDIRDQQTLHDNQNDESLSRALDKISSVLGDMNKHFTRIVGVKSSITHYRQNSEKLRQELAEIRERKSWLRRSVESILPAAIADREKKLEQRIDQSDDQLGASEANLPKYSDPNDIERFVAKIITELPSLDKALEQQIARPSLTIESGSIFDKLILARISDRPLHVREEDISLPCLGHEPFNPFQRLTTHFTVNSVVYSHMNGNWDNNNCVYLLPANSAVELNGLPEAISYADTWYMGDVKLPDGTVAIVSPDSPSFQVGLDKVKTLKIIVNDDPVGYAKDLLLRSGFRNSDLDSNEITTRLESANLRERLVGDTYHFDSIYRYLEAQSSQFIFHAISGDTDKALSHTGSFLNWYLVSLEKMNPESKAKIKQEYGFVLSAMEKYFSANGYDFEEIKERCSELSHKDNREDFYRSLLEKK